MSHDLNAVFYSQTYHPIQAGSIDGTDTAPHDNAVYRAMLATSTGLYDRIGDTKAQGNPYCIVFVGRLSRDTTEATLKEVMSKYGRIKHLRLVRHIVTGASQGYAFVEYETEKEMHYAYEAAHLIKIDGNQVLVDYNRQLLMPGWVPRRLGGGLGGRKESGQLRFGGRDRPFRKPLRPIPVKELEKLGISLPGGYMQRFETPPLPTKRRSSWSDAKTMSHGFPERDLKRMSSQEARHREEDDRNGLGQRQEERLTDFEEDNSKWYQRSQERRDSPKEDRYRDYARYKDNDNKRQQHNGKVYHQEESRRHLYEEEDEGYDRRPYHRDAERRDANKSHHRQEEDNKRRHGDRHDKIYYRGEEDNQRRLNERHKSRDPREDRRGRQHHLDHYGGGDYHNEDSGRSHHHDKHGKKDSHKKEDDRRQHYEREEDDDEEDREPKDRNYSKGHKRKHRSGADRVISDSLSSETDSRRKMQRRDGDGRFESGEPSVENRWEP